jgi:outer membrane cobalamin receptor
VSGNKVSAAEFQWFKKISSKGKPLTVITKQDLEKSQSINLVPVPIFLIQIEQE